MSILRDKIRQTAAREAAISEAVEKTGVVVQDNETVAAVAEISRVVSERHRDQISQHGLDGAKSDISDFL